MGWGEWKGKEGGRGRIDVGRRREGQWGREKGGWDRRKR